MTFIVVIITMSITAGLAVIGTAEEHKSNQGQSQNSVQGTLPTFPTSANCTTTSPCRNVTGEVVKIEESYWIAQPNGVQSHVRVVPETKIQSRVKVGDSIAAQVRSTGEAEAVLKMDPPKAQELPVPDSSLKEMR
jgi:hypothetical protein